MTRAERKARALQLFDELYDLLAPDDAAPEWLAVKPCAAHFGMSARTLADWTRANHVETTKAGRLVMVKVASVAAHLGKCSRSVAANDDPIARTVAFFAGVR